MGCNDGSCFRWAHTAQRSAPPSKARAQRSCRPSWRLSGAAALSPLLLWTFSVGHAGAFRPAELVSEPHRGDGARHLQLPSSDISRLHGISGQEATALAELQDDARSTTIRATATISTSTPAAASAAAPGKEQQPPSTTKSVDKNISSTIGIEDQEASIIAKVGEVLGYMPRDKWQQLVAFERRLYPQLDRIEPGGQCPRTGTYAYYGCALQKADGSPACLCPRAWITECNQPTVEDVLIKLQRSLTGEAIFLSRSMIAGKCHYRRELFFVLPTLPFLFTFLYFAVVYARRPDKSETVDPKVRVTASSRRLSSSASQRGSVAGGRHED
eukprot:TRINITY_DN113528_c0_g1_i1.p1 TRINITY_DN113528_c0_g1~~TRINITY_DN113528_c0_g1_i1.p1  ORF type:complete len:328 (-),score=70.03 TRINITY_DN113528_c0_g1_i1:42-1025(-)